MFTSYRVCHTFSDTMKLILNNSDVFRSYSYITWYLKSKIKENILYHPCTSFIIDKASDHMQHHDRDYSKFEVWTRPNILENFGIMQERLEKENKQFISLVRKNDLA